MNTPSIGTILDRTLSVLVRRKARPIAATLLAAALFGAAAVGVNQRWPVQRDCADVVMVAAARGLSADDARAAYQCFSPDGQFGLFRASLSEEAFVVQFASPNTDPTGRRVERVYRASLRNGTVVFFVVTDQRGVGAGYIVTLDDAGRVISVE